MYRYISVVTNDLKHGRSNILSLDQKQSYASVLKNLYNIAHPSRVLIILVYICG